MIAIRGAITVEKDDRDEILEASKELIQEVIERNGLSEDKIISIQFSSTSDIRAAYPAIAARQLGLKELALSCYQEADIENSLKKCIRVLFYVDINKKQKEAKHVYLKGARVLRPDLLDD